MLSTPIRKCAQSLRHLPSGMSSHHDPYLYDADRRDLTPDFLIRLSIKRVPSSQTGSKRRTYTLVPDGLQHPKYKGLDSHSRGHYIICRRTAIQEFDKRGTAPFITHSWHKAA